MHRLMILVSFLVALALTLGVGVAAADPPAGSTGTIVCNGVTYNVVSPGNRAVTGSDLNSTSQVLLITDKDPTFPQRLLTLCTAFPSDEPPFQAYFFITPAS
jgi:hypothetical protein